MSSTPYNPATLEFIQKNAAKRTRQRRIATGVGALLVASIATAGYFGVKAYKQSSQEATAKALVAKITATPGVNGFEEMRKAVDSGQITREQAWAAGREAMEAQMQKRMDEYFSTPAKDREKYLDKLIDERLKMMKEWEARRAAQGPTTRPDRGNRENGPTTRPDRGDREGRGPGGGGGGRGDNTSPVQRAQRGEFMAAMQRRMQERGIDMGRGGGRGGWGGGGGGRGR